VFVVEADKAVSTKTTPVAAGKVAVFDPATAGAAREIVPLVSPLILI
jgi:hypothetical protein